MKVQKVINNNVVSCIDDSGIESVAMGKGLGFCSHPGDSLNQSKVEKIFRLESQSETNRLKKLFATVSEKEIELCNQIIQYACENLNRTLSPSLYLTLTDHISFALERMEQGITFESALLAEVRTFYPREFAVGKYANELIRQKLGVVFPEDEAASIALHLVNAELDNSLSDTMQMTQALHNILEILRQSREIELEEGDSYFDEFTIQLKFLAIRTFAGTEERKQESEFVDFIRKINPKEYACATLIAEYLEKQTQNPVSDTSRAYLAIYIHRINKCKP